MAAVKDPESGLEFYELSHPWGMYTPIFPGYEEIKLERLTYHAKHGVMTHKISTIFHTSTHVNAPIHLLPEQQAVGDLALDRFFGTGVVVSIPKGKWERIEPAARYQTVEQALAARPMYFTELMASLGSKDGREIILTLDEMREQGQVTRGQNGEWVLTKEQA